MRNSFFHR